MKVVYLHQYFTTASSAGGTRSYEFARRLVRDGHEVDIVTSDRTGLSSPKTWTVAEVEGFRVHSIGQPYSNSMGPRRRIAAFLGFALQASRKARSLEGDVVFATSTPLTIVLPGLAAVFGRRTPFVMEVRDLWPSVPIALGYLQNPLIRALARGLERFAYKRARKIVALSEGMASGVRAAGGAANKIAVIPNMSDTARFRSGGDGAFDFSLRYPELADRPFIIYTGTFGRVNGVDYMVKLAKHYASIDSNLALYAWGRGLSVRV
jgi:glycosyltransferase involved in cell wall biosynthesis